MADQIDEANDLAQLHLDKSLAQRRQNADWVPHLSGLANPLANADLVAREKLLAKAGLCRGCGEEIGEARLKALPDTTRCIDCAKEIEGQRRD